MTKSKFWRCPRCGARKVRSGGILPPKCSCSHEPVEMEQVSTDASPEIVPGRIPPTAIVCDACGEQSCWHGELMCSDARTAGTCTRSEWERR